MIVRKILATLAVIWFLGVEVYVVAIFLRPMPHDIVGVAMFGWVGVLSGLFVAIVPIAIIGLVVAGAVTLWDIIAYKRETYLPQDMNLNVMGAIASVLHPKAAALVNVAQTIQAEENRPQAPTVSLNNSVDSDKL